MTATKRNYVSPATRFIETCQADSQVHSFFGSAFPHDNETGRALLATGFTALAANSEPSLACGVEPDEAYRELREGEHAALKAMKAAVGLIKHLENTPDP